MIEHMRIGLTLIILFIGLQPIYGQLKTYRHFSTSYTLERLKYTPSSTGAVSMLAPQYFNAKNLPVFCKMEHILDKKLPINVRMRLGNLDYVDRLEGKSVRSH